MAYAQNLFEPNHELEEHNARKKAADEFVALMDLRSSVGQIAQGAAMQYAPDSQREFKNLVLQNTDVKTLEQAARTILRRTYTAQELQALTMFYTTPLGRQVLDKYPLYMMELAPLINNELTMAGMKIQKKSYQEAKPERDAWFEHKMQEYRDNKKKMMLENRERTRRNEKLWEELKKNEQKK